MSRPRHTAPPLKKLLLIATAVILFSGTMVQAQGGWSSGAPSARTSNANRPSIRHGHPGRSGSRDAAARRGFAREEPLAPPRRQPLSE